jgi:hypothetical protein
MIINKENKTRREAARMEHLKIEDLKEFSSEKRIRKKLLSTEKLAAEAVCYDSDKAFHNTLIQNKMRFFTFSRAEVRPWSAVKRTR